VIVGRGKDVVSVGRWSRPKHAAVPLRPRRAAVRWPTSLLGRYFPCHQTQGGGKARKTRSALPWAMLCNAFGVINDSTRGEIRNV
jgi:hypothetical protein